MKYYSIDRILSIGADYNVIVGGRSNGKSYATGQQWIKNYLENGSQFVRAVRYIFDMQDRYVANYFCDDLLNKVKNDWNHVIWYDSPYYYIRHVDDSPSKKDILGHVMAISNEQKYKSNQYDRVTVIDMEEFALLNTSQYIDYETEKYQSMVSTIVRRRNNCTCWFVGNTISKYNPYFDMLNINIDKLQLHQGDLKIVEQPDVGYKEKPIVAIEFAEMGAELETEIPRLLKLGKNDTAVTGEYITPPDVVSSSDVKLKGRTPIIIQVGEIKFNMYLFECFVYWSLTVGKDKNKRTDAFVRTMCYDASRFFGDFVKDIVLPNEWYYDTEETKHYIEKYIRSVYV